MEQNLTQLNPIIIEYLNIMNKDLLHEAILNLYVKIKLRSEDEVKFDLICIVGKTNRRFIVIRS